MLGEEHVDGIHRHLLHLSVDPLQRHQLVLGAQLDPPSVTTESLLGVARDLLDHLRHKRAQRIVLHSELQ